MAADLSEARTELARPLYDSAGGAAASGAAASDDAPASGAAASGSAAGGSVAGGAAADDAAAGGAAGAGSGRGVATLLLLARVMVSSGIFQHSMPRNSSRLTLPSLLGSAIRIISSHSACVRASGPPALIMKCRISSAVT